MRPGGVGPKNGYRQLWAGGDKGETAIHLPPLLAFSAFMLALVLLCLCTAFSLSVVCRVLLRIVSSLAVCFWLFVCFVRVVVAGVSFRFRLVVLSLCIRVFSFCFVIFLFNLLGCCLR